MKIEKYAIEVKKLMDMSLLTCNEEMEIFFQKYSRQYDKVMDMTNDILNTL